MILSDERIQAIFVASEVFDQDDPVAFGRAVSDATAEACAKIIDEKYIELAKRAYPPPSILRTLSDAIREAASSDD